MRQLKLIPIKDRLTPAEFASSEAEQAGALPLLQNLSAAQPLGLDERQEKAWFRCIISVATQHRNQGTNWAELLTAGYTALAECRVRHAKRPSEFDRWAAWWIRQGIVRILPGNRALEG